MSGTEGVVFAFGAFGEARKPTALTQGADAVTTTCQNLVRIGLVAHVPDDLVVRCVEDVMQGDGKFDHTKTRTQMPASDGHGVDGLGPQFISDLTQIGFRQFAQIRRLRDAVQKGCVRFCAQKLQPRPATDQI